VKIIHKSIIKELLLAFLIAIPVLNFILMMEKVLKLSRLLSSVGASPAEMARILLMIQPELMTLTIPMAFLLSVLYTYGRMNADNELLVLKSSGMSFKDAAKPAFALGTLCVVLGLALSLAVAPAVKKSLRRAVVDTLREHAPEAIEPGAFNSLLKDTVIYVSGGSRDRLEQIFIYDERKQAKTLVRYAREAAIVPAAADDGTLALKLKNGSINITNGEHLTEVFFSNYRMLLPLSIDEPGVRLGELGTRELLKDAGRFTGFERTRRLLEADRRFSFALFPLAMMLLAPALALVSGKRGRLGGLAMGTTVFTLYYVALTYTERLSEAGRISHIVGGWSPFALLLVVSFFVFRKVNSR
jgi:lipopolysaccharide export system permease protein